MVKLAVIGYGYWGPNLVRNFKAIKNVEVALCCDLIEENLLKFKNQYPTIKTSDNCSEVFNDSNIDAIVIASSAATHYELAKQALKSNKHVFVEKPLALSSREAEELVRLADEKNRVLMVGHLLKYHPAVDQIKGYIKNGEIGKINYLYSQRLNLGKIRKDENSLWSLAPHDISVILYLLEEEPIEVSAVGEFYLRDGVEDVIFCSLKFPDNILAHIHVSWLDPHKVRKLTIVGDKKMIVFDDMQSSEKIWIYDKGVEAGAEYKSYGEDLTLRFGDIVVPKVNMVEPLRVECEHFIGCIEERKTPRSDGRDGLRVVKVLEAAQESLNKGGVPVKIS